MTKKIKVGILGSPDSTTTQALLRELKEQGLTLDFYIFWSPDLHENWKRLRFMWKKSGWLAAVEAVWHAVWSILFGAKQATDYGSASVYFVRHHNSEECRQILLKEQPDILLLSTNAIIKQPILAIPRLATLNAHPAWLPTFRGFGSSHYQLKAGYHLAVSVHAVDTGIDSGGVFARESIELDLHEGIHELRRQLFGIKPDIHRLMAKLFIQTIQALMAGTAKPLDTSTEKNQLYRGGMPLAEQYELDALLKSPTFSLKKIDASGFIHASSDKTSG